MADKPPGADVRKVAGPSKKVVKSVKKRWLEEQKRNIERLVSEPMSDEKKQRLLRRMFESPESVVERLSKPDSENV